MIQLGEVFKKHKLIIAVGCLAVIGVLSALFLTAKPSIDWMAEFTIDDVSSMEIVTYASGSTHIAKQPTQEEKAAVVTLCNAFYGTETQWEAFPNEEELRVTIHSTGVLTHTLILYVKEAMEQVALQVDEQYFLLDTDQTVAWMDLVKYVTSKSAVAQPETPPTETPDITEIKQVIHTQMADVTHDGIPDIIETTISVHSEDVDKDLQALLNQTYPCDIAVYDPILSTNTPIYEQSYGAPHTGNGQLSLAEIDGLSYLLEGSLYTGQGYYTFAHSIFSLDSQGNRQVKAEDSTEGQISDGDAASKINTYFSNLTPWVERATAIAILDINLENQMVSTEDESYLAKDYYEAMGEYYNEMACEYALLSTPQPLTADELSYFNETYFNGATGQNLNPANQFLHNSFDLPINIDLFMLFYHGAGADYAMSEDGEYDAVAQAYGFDSWAEIPTDVTPIPKTSMDDMLEQYTGIDLFASNKIGLENFKYLEEYDCYYNLHGDTNYYGTVEFVSGTQTGDQIALSYYNSWQQADYILTLVDYGGGDYKIYSNLPAIIAE